MFWKKKKTPSIPPLGLILEVSLNLSKLEKLVSMQESAEQKELLKDRYSFNPLEEIEQGFRILLVNSIKNSLIIYCNQTQSFYGDLSFKVNLPYSIGKKKIEEIEISSYAPYFEIRINDAALLKFPSEAIIRLLTGDYFEEKFSMAQMENAPKKELSNADILDEYSATSLLDTKGFLFQNAVVKVHSYVIENIEELLVMNNQGYNT